MQAITTIALRREFANRTQAEAYRFFQQQESDQRKKRERDEDIYKDVADLGDLAVVMVSQAQVRELRLQIDRYDTATVNALYENEQALLNARKRLDEILSDAYVLPDGRRVFKTEDGMQVFDENGNEVDPSVVEPDQIEDWRPRWEAYDDASEEVERLEQERSDLVGYQDRLDAARERLEAGDMTQDEYDRLQQELTDAMPEAVRRQIPELANADPEPQFADLDLDITDDMVPTSSGGSAPAPGG